MSPKKIATVKVLCLLAGIQEVHAPCTGVRLWWEWCFSRELTLECSRSCQKASANGPSTTSAVNSTISRALLSTGLGPPSLHQALPPGYPPALTGSIPPPYQFARDPQTGQVVVIPTEHLPHYGMSHIFFRTFIFYCISIHACIR